MSYNLFLDDNFTPIQIADITIEEKNRLRYRKYRWIIAKSYEEFISIIKDRGLPSIVSFDHDLAPEHWEFLWSEKNWLKNDEEIVVDYDTFEIKTGYHAAEWLLEYCYNKSIETPIMLVHSQNPVGKKNIQNLLF